MKKSKNFLKNGTIYDIETLKQEIDMRYHFVQYKKLHKQYLLNRIEKNNVNILLDTLYDLKYN